MQGKPPGLNLPAGLPARQTEAADPLQALIQCRPARLPAIDVEATSAERPLTTLSRSMLSRTTAIVPVPTEMYPTAGSRVIPDPAHVTSPGSMRMTDTGTMIEATTAAVLMIGTLAAKEEEAAAPAQVAELLHIAENGKGTALAAMTAAATSRHSNHEALTVIGTAAETIHIKAATIVMTETDTQDATETEAVAATGTAEGGPLALHCTAVHGDAQSEHPPSPPQFLIASSQPKPVAV